MSRAAPAGEGDVLAQPTRARVFAHLASLGRPAGTDELAEQLGLHPSGVRVHLDRLLRAGLVSRELMPPSKGRPRHTWSIAPDALPGGDPPESYRLLASWLARSIPSTPARLREVERSGRQIGGELGPSGRLGSAEESMGRALTALGFAPQRDQAPPGRAVFKLGSCPYRDAVRINQPVVCALHRGITRGLLDSIEPAATLKDFVPQDPDRAGCLIDVAGLGAG